MPHAADETGLEPLGFALALDPLGRMRRALYSSDCPRRSAVGSTRLIGVRFDLAGILKAQPREAA